MTTAPQDELWWLHFMTCELICVCRMEIRDLTLDLAQWLKHIPAIKVHIWGFRFTQKFSIWDLSSTWILWPVWLCTQALITWYLLIGAKCKAVVKKSLLTKKWRPLNLCLTCKAAKTSGWSLSETENRKPLIQPNKAVLIFLKEDILSFWCSKSRIIKASQLSCISVQLKKMTRQWNNLLTLLDTNLQLSLGFVS